MRSILLAMVVCLGGCEKAKPPPYDGPMPVVFGDCAGPTVAWVSGPRPLPFTAREAEGIWEIAKVETPPPTPTPPPAAGSAVARDEGHMARDPAAARREAIEAARNFGALGSVSLSSGAFASLTGTGDISSGFDDSNIYGGLLGGEVGIGNGGFGYGAGGGGTGWGTIGTGRYGTIGGGHGLGVGGRLDHGPRVAIGLPNANGDLDKAIIRRYIKRNIQKIQSCYERRLLAKPEIAGTVTAQFFIATTGVVETSTASGVDREVASCVAGIIKGIEFPKPKGGGGVQVSYPFTFRPTGSDASAGSNAGSAKPADADSGASPPEAAGSAAAGSAAVPAVRSAAVPAVGGGSATPAGRAMFRERPVDATHYKVGATNPLRDETAALTTCFRSNPTHHGVVVVELHYDGAGVVTSSLAHGLDDEATRACVLEVARRAKRADPATTAQRCSLAFGELPPSELPALEITDAIKLDGKSLATVAAVEKADGHDGTIPELEAAVAAKLALAVAPGPVILQHEPLMVRVPDAMPMRVVYRVLNSLRAAGDDFVLAAQHGATWQLLPTLALPVVPVPFGTGGKWSRYKSHGHTLQGDEHVELSLLITKDQIWVGLSRVNEFQELKREATQSDKLATALHEHKASAFFLDRTDLEIAADDTIPYSEVVAVVAAVEKAGFTDWMLTDPRSLSARPSL